MNKSNNFEKVIIESRSTLGATVVTMLCSDNVPPGINSSEMIADEEQKHDEPAAMTEGSKLPKKSGGSSGNTDC